MKSIRWMALGVFAVLLLIGLFFTADRRVAQAQQLPPKPDPLACCERMAPGGNTIGGPAVSTLTPGDVFFPLASINVRNVCITIQNIAGSPVEVGNGTDLGWRVSTVAAGETQTHCMDLRLGAGVATRCEGCVFWWRLDKF